MRYALRNKDRIKAHFGQDGEEIVKRITDSLESFFNGSNDIKDFIVNEPNHKFPILTIADAHHTSNLVSFYIVRVQFNVYTLAFREFIG